ncbi:Mut7-C RNAse domain-containing protein, partial [Streptomyces sp. 2MCAF27]
HGTRRTYHVFAQCTVCERVYWRGAHHARLEEIVRQAMGEFGAPIDDRPSAARFG